MSTWVSLADVATRYEQPIPAGQDAYVCALIAEAETILLARLPGLPAMLTADKVPLAVVKIVVIRAVLRVLRNPEGYTSESAGDYSYRVDQAVASGRLDYTAQDMALVDGSAGAGTRAPRSIGVRAGSPWQIPDEA